MASSEFNGEFDFARGGRDSKPEPKTSNIKRKTKTKPGLKGIPDPK